MTTEELTTCWVPIPLRWRHVADGDTILGHDGGLWMIDYARNAGAIHVRAVRGQDEHMAIVDPDETVQVLVPIPEREALTIARDELAARVVERRSES